MANIAKRQGRPGQVKAGGFIVFQPNEKIVEGKGQQQSQQDFGNEDAGEQEDARTGENAEGGIESRAVSISAAAPGPGQDGQTEYPQGERQMGGEYIESEEAVVGRRQPVRQRWLFQITDAIHFQRDPVAGARHGLRGVRVVGVGVIQQRGRKECCKMDGGEDQEQQRPGTHRGED